MSATAELWQHIFGHPTGRTYLFTVWSGQRIEGIKDLLEPRQKFLPWPEGIAKAERWLQDESAEGREVYFGAHLLTAKRRIKANAADLLALYVDGDGAEVQPGQPRPTAIVRSSPGREQFYWRLTRPVDPKVGEQLNRRLAYAMGADTSGWDLTQVLRPPGTRNRKYPDRPLVELVAIEDRAYDPDELDRILPPLPEGKQRERSTARVEHTSTAGGSADADRRILEKMARGQRGDQLRRLLDGDAGDYRKADGSPDWSAADLALCNAFAFYADRDAARMDQLFRGSGLYSAPGRAEKWDERHYSDGRTYGEGTIGTAIAGCSRTYSDLVGYPADKEWPRIQITGRPVNDNNHGGGGQPELGTDGAETCPTADQGADRLAELEAENARLRLALLERDDKVEHLASIVEAQQAIINTQRAELERERFAAAENARLRAAENELRKVKTFNATQKDAILATARIVSYRASRGNEAPIVTRKMVAEDIGCHEATAGAALKVFDLPGSPITRVPEYIDQTDEDGTPLRKKIVHFKVETASPADIIETMVGLGQALATRPRRYQNLGCPKHPDAETVRRIMCAECGMVLEGPPLDPPPGGDEPRCERLATIGDPPPPVVDPVPSTERLAPIGAVATNGHAHPNGQGARNGHAAGVATLPRAPAPAEVWRCLGIKRNGDACCSLERRQRPDGGWACLGCGWPAPAPEGGGP